MENAGRLEAGASYSYAKIDGVVYATNRNDPSGSVIEVGRDYGEPQVMGVPVDQMIELAYIIKEAKGNPILQDALDQLRTLCALIRTSGDDIPHYPV